MLILGIDPGTATTGYGLIKVNKKDYEVKKFGLIQTDKDGIPGDRLNDIYDQMMKIFSEYKPDVMAIEKLFFATNAKTAMRVGQAQGVMLFAASRAKTLVVEYAPGTIKKVVAGDGRADKKLIQKAVRKYLGAKVRSRKRKKTHFDNAADALAVAVCHALKNGG
ncbi:MAG: crossover junction endodeoxyribonuclease RuvC [Patescibacteria group bacterium]